jgi:uncharacterized membrane protein YqjE
MAAGFVVAAIVFVLVGLALLIVGAVSTWRAYRAASRRANELSAYTFEEASAIAELSTRLNADGFDLEHTVEELFPKIARITRFMQQPMVALAVPWLLRRAFGRPYRRR